MSVGKPTQKSILVIPGYHCQSSCGQNVDGNSHKSVPSNVMDQSRVASLPIYIIIPNPSHDNQFPSSSHDENHDKTHTQIMYPMLVSESWILVHDPTCWIRSSTHDPKLYIHPSSYILLPPVIQQHWIMSITRYSQYRLAKRVMHSGHCALAGNPNVY